MDMTTLISVALASGTGGFIGVILGSRLFNWLDVRRMRRANARAVAERERAAERYVASRMTKTEDDQ